MEPNYYVADMGADIHGKLGTQLKVTQQKHEVPCWKKIQLLFKNRRVVTFEEIEPLIGDNSETFWLGEKLNGGGMLDYLAENGYEMIPYKDKSGFITEIYVNHEKFRVDYEPETPIPSFKTSGSIVNHPLLNIMREQLSTLSKKLGKKNISIFMLKDKIGVTFSGELTLSQEKLRELVNNSLS